MLESMSLSLRFFDWLSTLDRRRERMRSMQIGPFDRSFLFRALQLQGHSAMHTAGTTVY